MSKPEDLPHLIRLLDDDSPVVQETILRELAAFGPWLRLELSRLSVPLSKEQQVRMHSLIEDYNRSWLREAWKGWDAPPEEMDRLETALSLVAEFQYGRGYPVKLKPFLDRLAEEFHNTSRKHDALALSHFLFRSRKLRGNETDYHSPFNSNLIHVIEEKKGLPISLACVYMLVGARSGLEIGGINFPGHFLARASAGGQRYVVDCFNGGRFLDERDLVNATTGTKIPIAELLQQECDVTTIVARTLRNLVNAYQHEQNAGNAALMSDLLDSMESEDEEEDLE